MRAVPFRCVKCGECCRHLVGRQWGMALTPDEYRRLNRAARWRGLKLNVVPLVAGAIGAKLYQMAEDICPFLDGRGRCIVYEQRPLVCRMFPLHPAGLMTCTALTKQVKMGLPVEFPPDIKRAAYEYMGQIDRVIKGADLVYGLNAGWRPKSWFTNKPKVGL